MWIGVVAIIVIAALGLWWIASGQPLSAVFQSAIGGTNATSTATTTVQQHAPKRTISRSGTDVASIVASLPQASKFAAIFRSSGIASTIGAQSVSKYTIFVPTDGAYSQLPAGTISNLSAAELKRLVQYHVVSGRAIDIDAQTAGTIQALSGDYLNFNYGADHIPMVNSSIIVAEYDGTNGTVYLVDNVLLPPKESTI
jgi:uncharacterized surface protein with fasciclin (FAS1) repeats